MQYAIVRRVIHSITRVIIRIFKELTSNPSGVQQQQNYDRVKMMRISMESEAFLNIREAIYSHMSWRFLPLARRANEITIFYISKIF